MGLSPDPMGKRPRIGLLVDQLSSEYTETVVRGVIAAASQHDVETVCFVGGKLRPVDLEPDGRGPFDLATPKSVDALIVLPLGGCVGAENLAAFCRRYRPLPVCGIAIPWAVYPSVLVDNETGLRGGILHLIQAHGRRRIAFVAGPSFSDEAQLRLDVYRKVLAENGIAFDPLLVAPGTFEYDGGVQAVKLLLDARRVTFEAVVCANDASATGVLEDLKRRGIAVPREVSVLGFDDLRMSRYLDPALTTIRQPVREQARLAVENVLAELRGGRPQGSTILPTQLVIRESCGCSSHAHPIASTPEPVQDAARDLERLRLHAAESAAAMRAAAVEGAPDTLWPEELYAQFCAEVAGRESSFSRDLARVAVTAARAEGDPGALHKVITVLSVASRRSLHGEALRRADSLLHAARIKLSGIVGRIPTRRWQEAHNHMWTLIDTNRELAHAATSASVKAALDARLAAYSIEGVYVCTYEPTGAPDEWARLIFACSSSGTIELPAEGVKFVSAELLPEGTVPPDRAASLVVCPLESGAETRGYVVFDGRMMRANLYEGLAAQIGATIGKIRLLERLVAAAREREIAEAKRLQAEMQIAAGIQTAILPQGVHVEGLEIAAAMLPATEVGGDYYDVIPDERGCWMGIGDVTGHGLTAGLAVLMVHSVVRGVSRCNPGAAPSEIFSVVNTVLLENLHRRMNRDELATLTLIRYEPNGHVVCAGAHEVILVCRGDDGRVDFIETPGPWIGLVADVRGLTPDTDFQLGPGDVMVLFTDGITEARNDRGEMFGVERLARAIPRARHGSAEDIRDALLGAVKEWTATQQDDMSIVVVRRRG
jgi:DNA-binding LacI/PurR family transcriptional regulator/serine phosphatase RsbU (regulator of sigma subunit)